MNIVREFSLFNDNDSKPVVVGLFEIVLDVVNRESLVVVFNAVVLVVSASVGSKLKSIVDKSSKVDSIVSLSVVLANSTGSTISTKTSLQSSVLILDELVFSKKLSNTMKFEVFAEFAHKFAKFTFIYYNSQSK